MRIFVSCADAAIGTAMTALPYAPAPLRVGLNLAHQEKVAHPGNLQQQF
ncbi:MAG: hypothetical protein ABIO31_01545 [Candidatus Nitrotoga sp.]